MNSQLHTTFRPPDATMSEYHLYKIIIYLNGIILHINFHLSMYSPKNNLKAIPIITYNSI